MLCESLRRLYVFPFCIASWCLYALTLPDFHTTHLPAGMLDLEQENPAMEPADLVSFMCCRRGPKQIIFYSRIVFSYMA